MINVIFYSFIQPNKGTNYENIKKTFAISSKPHKSYKKKPLNVEFSGLLFFCKQNTLHHMRLRLFCIHNII
jgi:hypothetical protein